MSEQTISKDFIDIIPRAMRSIRTETRKIAGSELTVVQFRVMAQLSHGPSTNRELADGIGVSIPCMSRLVDSMVQRALIERTGDLHDRRRVSLELSKAGRKKFASVKKAAEGTFVKRFSSLSQQERENLAAGLAVLNGVFT